MATGWKNDEHRRVALAELERAERDLPQMIALAMYGDLKGADEYAVTYALLNSPNRRDAP